MNVAIGSSRAEQLNTSNSDSRGWFYRAIAPSPDAEVLAVGADFADRWFSRIETSDLAGYCDQPNASPRFAMVIVHCTLGGCQTIEAVFRAAHGVLKPNGIVVLSGENWLRASRDGARAQSTVPRATLWGYRRAARKAGLSNVDTFIVQPDLDDPAYVVSTAASSARAFFRFEVDARKAWARTRFPLFRAAIAELNLAPFFQAHFIIVARKC